MDPRYQQLADVLIKHSCRVQPGERFLIEAVDIPRDFVIALIRTVNAAGGLPFVWLKDPQITRAIMECGSQESWTRFSHSEMALMLQMQCYLGVRGGTNISELSDISSELFKLYEDAALRPVHLDFRIKHTKWCVTRFPTSSMAQLAKMSTEAFEDFFLRVCTLDYDKMAEAVKPLKNLMEKTDRVRLLGPGKTDLTFSIKDIPAIPCCGEHNIPDGEIFTAPVRESVNGTICYNCPTIYRGTPQDNVCLVFHDGKIIEATGSDTTRLNEILDTDEGARYIGEFALGFNPYCEEPMTDILFDEKIAGSIHFTPGKAYDEANNGNKSAVHWDMVMRQTEQVGGGKIFFDDQLVRENGLFVLPELEGLNPSNLIGG